MIKEEIIDMINRYKQEMIENLAEFVSINSIYDENSVNALNPFGKGVSSALEYIYDLAQKDGFKVTNYDNYCVEIEYGEGDIVDVLAHCDVVDVSQNWQFDPFSKLYDDKYVYGRGTQDDKGPLLAAYYALKAIKDNNITTNKKIRLIIGGNEESGSACLDYYYNKLNKEYPSMGFTPDAQFPLINGEKGITRIEVICDDIDQDILDISGGRALNIVMDEVTIQTTKKLFKYKGKAAHASKPEMGENAFINALYDLKDEYSCFNRIYDDFTDYYGKGLNIDCYDEQLKNLTMNIGKTYLVNHKLHIILDIRYPLKTNAWEIVSKIEAKGYKAKILMDEKPMYIDENSKLVKTLMDCYNQFMNTNSKPYTIGGGTYAKSSKNVVAYGMLFDDDMDLMHQDNEKIRIDHYLLGAQIYLNALINLIK